MAKKRQTVWVIMHYEFGGCSGSPYVDSLQFHVSSTLANAEKYMLRGHVAAYSWWQVHPHLVDTVDFITEGEEVYYYSHRGKRLKSAPYVKARAAFDRHAARYPQWYPKSKPKAYLK